MRDKDQYTEAMGGTRALGIALILSILVLVGGCLFFAGCPDKTVKAELPMNLIAKQHRADACVLAAVATSMNYKLGKADYTSAGLALAYKAKYGRDDWALNGDTSHQAQALAEIAGFKVEYDRLDWWGKVAALKFLAWDKRYPVVFLAGQPTNHAVTVLVLLDNDDLLIADPWTGETYRENADSVYNKLEPEKWYFALR